MILAIWLQNGKIALIWAHGSVVSEAWPLRQDKAGAWLSGRARS